MYLQVFHFVYRTILRLISQEMSCIFMKKKVKYGSKSQQSPSIHMVVSHISHNPSNTVLYSEVLLDLDCPSISSGNNEFAVEPKMDLPAQGK